MILVGGGLDDGTENAPLAEAGLMHGSVPAGEIGWVLVSSVLLVAVFGPITMVLYRNKK